MSSFEKIFSTTKSELRLRYETSYDDLISSAIDSCGKELASLGGLDIFFTDEGLISPEFAGSGTYIVPTSTEIKEVIDKSTKNILRPTPYDELIRLDANLTQAGSPQYYCVIGATQGSSNINFRTLVYPKPLGTQQIFFKWKKSHPEMRAGVNTPLPNEFDRLYIEYAKRAVYEEKGDERASVCSRKFSETLDNLIDFNGSIGNESFAIGSLGSMDLGVRTARYPWETF